MPLVYEEVKLEIGYRIDIMVENKLIIEVKAVEVLNLAHKQRPADRDVLYALVSFLQKAGNIKGAKHYANILVQVSPWDQNAKALLERL